MDMTLPPIAATSILQSDDIAALTGIFEPECQVSLWHRPEPAGVAAYLQAALDAGRLGRGFRKTLGINEACDFPELPDLPGKQTLVDDLQLVAEVFSELLGCPGIGLRLEVLDKAMCPRFHVDRTGIRLLCTYRGPGTEWLPEHLADRSRMGPLAGGLPDASSGLIRDNAAIGRAPGYSLVLLKGSLWQGNAGRGAIHRSPAVSENEAPRIVLALDAVW